MAVTEPNNERDLHEAAESETFERKSRFADATEDWATIVKTIVAMANTTGGCILLEHVDCNLAELDSAKLDDKVNKYVGPRVRGITAWARPQGEVEIRVPESDGRPHIFRCDLAVPGKPGKGFFYPGQVWVRHGSKNEPATPEDFEHMVRHRVALSLAELRVRVLQADAPLALTTGDGMPVRFSSERDAIPVIPDVDRTHPYTARTMGQTVGKGQNWAAAAAECLEMKGKPEFWFGTRGSRGYAVQRYSERAVDSVRTRLKEDPAWNPFAELKTKGKRPRRRKSSNE